MVVQQKKGSPYLWIEVLDGLLVRVHADDYLPEPGPVNRLPIDRVRLHDVEELREVVSRRRRHSLRRRRASRTSERSLRRMLRARANRDSRTARRAWRSFGDRPHSVGRRGLSPRWPQLVAGMGPVPTIPIVEPVAGRRLAGDFARVPLELVSRFPLGYAVADGYGYDGIALNGSGVTVCANAPQKSMSFTKPFR